MPMLWFVAAFWLAIVEYFCPGTIDRLAGQIDDQQVEPYSCEVQIDEDGGRVPRLRIPPRYPDEALRDEIEGRVLLEGTISRDGRILDPWVVAEEPEGVFGDTALSAFREWEYCPLPEEATFTPEPYRIAIPFRIGTDAG